MAVLPLKIYIVKTDGQCLQDHEGLDVSQKIYLKQLKRFPHHNTHANLHTHTHRHAHTHTHTRTHTRTHTHARTGSSGERVNRSRVIDYMSQYD